MKYNTAIIYLTADENFVSYGTIDGYVYQDPIFGYGFTYTNTLCSGTFASLSAYPPLSALPVNDYTNTSTFSASENIVIRRHEQNEFLFIAPIIITYSLSGVQQTFYKIQKVSSNLNNNLVETNVNLVNPTLTTIKSVSGTYETTKNFLESYSASISCYRENFYVDVFVIHLSCTQPSIIDPVLDYKILNYQLLDDARNYLLTLQGYNMLNVHYGVLGTGDYLFNAPPIIRPELPPLEFAITILPAITSEPIYPVIPPLSAYCALITILNNELLIGVNVFNPTYLVPISCVAPIY